MIKTMKKIFLSILIILLSISIYSQNEYTQTIRGKVIDKHSQMPLPGATIILLNSKPQIGTITENDGEFKFQNIPIGRRGIVVSFMGYNSATLNNINLTSGKEVVLTIQLEEQVITTEEIVITAKQRKDKALNKMAMVSARSFSIEETERFAGSLGDPSRMVANYAGVAMTNDSRNDIIIRGNSPTGLLWRLDGIEIPNPNHFGAFGTTGGPVSILNNNLLTNSDFFTSAFPAEYGNAISGVFDLKMRAGNNQNREYVGQVGFNGFEFGAEGPFVKGKKASYLINYRYSTLGLMQKMGIDFGTGSAIPQYQDLTFKLNFPSVKYGRFSLIGIGGLSFIELHDSGKLEADSDADSDYDMGGVDLDFGSDMGVLGLSHLFFFNEKTRIETFLSIQGTRSTTYIDSLKFNDDGKLLLNSNYTFYGMKGSEVKYSASTHLSKKFSKKNYFTTGIYADIYSISLLDSVWQSKEENFRPNFDNITGSLTLIRAYMQWKHRFNDDFTLNTGVYSHFADINEEFTVEPRLGIKYNLTKTQSLTLGYGLHSQLQPRYYYFIQTRLKDGSFYRTNKELKMTKSHQVVLSYDKLFQGDIRIKAEAYYQSLSDIPVHKRLTEFSLVNTGTNFGGDMEDSLVSEGTGQNYGVELTFEKFFSKGYYFLTTVSVFDSKYKGYSDTERNTAYNGRYVINALGGYEFKVGKHSALTVDLKVVYAGGKRYVPVDIDKSIAENQTEYDWSKAYEKQFDDYFRTDIRIGFKLNGKHINQEWAVDLQNVSNNKNIYSQAYNPRKKDLSSDYQTGFMPMFLWRIQF